ncbi:alcohol dehydrogenase catalytic domain-containing protein [Kibdelosporangium phytohabitans]|uniref:Alcohol dehydrogenase n=1 Tax=Kibdelosporangium phytohabitans TaxID=860235 RepID=A0A0N9IFC8_9PSEU|nr:alcohol dehydrogenase catalytic domain-containing protein [Kibdelosporangium phytohabitans]ALG13506.1 alcohol dehydrogenase [Kibdelosporangium phytohabitans]MBE1465356.1 S-(hydroxymethyl)glutathione dehydrogenase/alcohol dehydrogenase [Kibdelosporangium phytohabitans]
MVNAAVAAGPDADIQVREIELPTPGPRDVRVRVAAAGVCHSDLSMINGTFAPKFPLVLGHEAAGTIAEVGSEVTRVAVGDRVVVNWAPACRHCWFCLNQQPWLCTSVEGMSSLPRGTIDGDPLHVTLGVGAFAEEVVVDQAGVVPLSDGVPLDVAALLGCAVVTGIGAVRNTAGVRPGESVVVIGLGGVGLSAIIGARLAGAAPIIAVDVAPEKEKLARDAGATHFILAHDKLAKEIRSLTGGRGVDHALECVGNSKTIRTAWQTTRRGGKATIVGAGRKDDQVSFSALELYHFARTLGVSVYGSGDPDRDIPALATQIELGRLDLEPLVSHRIGLDGVAGAFERMKTGTGARSLLVFKS